MSFVVLFAALVLDRYWSGQGRLWQRYSHPVVLFGRAIDLADSVMRRPGADRPRNRVNGLMSILVLLALAAFAGWAISLFTRSIPIIGLVAEVLIVAVLLAQRSLADHVGAVAMALRSEGLSGGRREVAKIVGRDPEQLDHAGVARSAIESLAENTSDGIVAPAFWYAILGLPGLFAYKMLNTADSMIGHKNERYLDFGRASAKIDDAANWVPARLTGLVIVIAAASSFGSIRAGSALMTMMRDARLHRSPNAGWPEAAFAGSLGVQLSGPRTYDGSIANEPVVNAAGRAVKGASDIQSALRLFDRICLVLAIIVAVSALTI